MRRFHTVVTVNKKPGLSLRPEIYFHLCSLFTASLPGMGDRYVANKQK